MRKLENPNLNYGEIYDSCISSFSNNSKNTFLRDRFINIREKLLAYVVQYDDLAKQSNLHKLHGTIPNDFNISESELIKLYTDKLSKNTCEARKYYNKILSLPEHGMCPFCAQRTVSTLDHYLPKKQYPLFSIYPSNLIPSCKDCNSNKLSYCSINIEDQLIHPFFDDFDFDTWLYAEVIEEPQAPSLSFYLEPPCSWEKTMIQRLQNHFKVLKLFSLYTSHAASELANISYYMKILFDSGGTELVRQHLHDSAVSYQSRYINSWQSAMYTALSKSDWYCEFGF